MRGQADDDVDAEADDPELDDGILVPNPADQWVELDLLESENRVCDLPTGGGGCV